MLSDLSPTTLPLSSALSPSRCLPPLHLSSSQVRSLSVGVSHPNTTSTLKCALYQSASPTPTPVQTYQVGVFLSHTTSTLKCALSNSVSPSPTPLPLSSALSPSRCLPPPVIPFHSQVRSLPVGVSHPHTIPTPSSAPSPSRCLPPPLIPFHSQVRSLRVGISLLHITRMYVFVYVYMHVCTVYVCM